MPKSKSKPPSTKSQSTFQTLDTVLPSVDAADFFSTYISKRKPVVIKGLLDDAAFKGRNWVSTLVENLLVCVVLTISGKSTDGPGPSVLDAKSWRGDGVGGTDP